MRTKSLPAKSVTRRSQRIYLLVAGLLLLVIVGWACGGVCAICNEQASRNLSRLDKAAANGWLQWAERIGPDNAHTQLLKARLARQIGDYDEMHLRLRRCERLRGNPQLVQLELLLARAQVGDLEEIESELNRLLGDVGQDHAELCDAYSNGLATLGRIDELQPLLSAWEKDFPNDPRPNHRRGRVFEFRQDLDAAAQQYAQATSKNSDFYPSWYSLGRTQQLRRKIDEALESYRRCQQMANPLAADVAIAGCLRELGESDQARELLENALKSDAQLLRNSLQQVEASLDGDPVRRELGALESDAGNFQRASELLLIALQTDPQDLTARYALAIAQRGLGNREEAERNFEHVRVARQSLATAPPLLDRVAKNPNDTAARLQLAEIHLKWESARKGVYWLQSVLAYEPTNVQAHRLLAEYFQAQSATQPELQALARRHSEAAQRGSQP